MRLRARAALVATAVVVIEGCANGSPNAPTPVEILPQTYSLVCEAWSPTTPPVKRTLVDIRVKGSGDGLTESELQTLRQNGADIVHQFAAGRLVRVAVDVAQVLPLHGPTFGADGGFVAYATRVSSPASYKVTLIVKLDHPVTNQDLAAVEALGGTIKHVYTSALIGYSVEIEDTMVSRLRSLPGVIRSELSDRFCAT